MARPHDEWPRIALFNRIEYTDAQHPMAACGFLIDTGDGVVAATAKHVLKYFRSEAMDSVSFRGTLKSWSMFVKNSPDDAVVLERLINEDREESIDAVPVERDWLLFTIREPLEDVQPLLLRSDPLVGGEPVFVVGWRYPDEGPQRVLEGKFVRRDGGSLLVSVPALRNNTIPGLSGAPVIDARGRVLGLMSRKAGKLQRLSPVDYPREVLQARP